jgi:RNA exonuclease 4
MQVTDARATMAVYRLHRKEWEKGNKQLVRAADSGKKRKRSEKPDLEDAGTDEAGDDNGANVVEKNRPPRGGRKGVSSGLTTIIRRGAHGKTGTSGEKTKWWKELAGGSSKGSLRL